MALAQLLRGAQALVGVRRRHADVDDRDVRLERANLQEQLVGVACLADDLEARILEQAGHALAQQDRVVGDQDSQAGAEPALGDVGAQGRELAAVELVDPLRPLEAAQLVHAEIAQLVGRPERRAARLRESTWPP